MVMKVNPDIQKGSGIPLNLNSCLLTGITFGKAFVNLSDRPQLRELFKATICSKPFSVKCLSCLMIS